jgi:hypothetical protein
MILADKTGMESGRFALGHRPTIWYKEHFHLYPHRRSIMIRIAFSRIAVAALCVMSAALAQAQGPAARPGTVTGPIGGVGRSQARTPERRAGVQGEPS